METKVIIFLIVVILVLWCSLGYTIMYMINREKKLINTIIEMDKCFQCLCIEYKVYFQQQEKIVSSQKENVLKLIDTQATLLKNFQHFCKGEKS